MVPEPDSRLESEMLGEQIGNLPMLLYSSVAVQPEYFLDLFCFHLPSVTLLQRLPDCNLFIPLLAICATAEACASRGPCLKAF